MLDIDVTKPEGADCTVTANPQKDKYSFGEEIELTFDAPEGYKLDSLTVDGEDRYNDVKANLRLSQTERQSTLRRRLYRKSLSISTFR